MKKNYFYDCIRNTLTVNKKFLDEASIYNSTEYKGTKQYEKHQLQNLHHPSR